jgi:hypothetical protein
MADNMDLGYEDHITYVGSSDSLVPSSVFLSSIRIMGGSKNEHANVSNYDGRKTISLHLSNIFCILTKVEAYVLLYRPQKTNKQKKRKKHFSQSVIIQIVKIHTTYSPVGGLLIEFGKLLERI